MQFSIPQDREGFKLRGGSDARECFRAENPVPEHLTSGLCQMALNALPQRERDGVRRDGLATLAAREPVDYYHGGVPVRGRLSRAACARIVSVGDEGVTFRIDDENNPEFWAEFTIPLDGLKQVVS